LCSKRGGFHFFLEQVWSIIARICKTPSLHLLYQRNTGLMTDVHQAPLSSCTAQEAWVYIQERKRNMKQPFFSHLTRLPNSGYRAGLLVGLLVILLGVGLFTFTSTAHPAYAATTSRASVFNASCTFSGAELIYQRDQTHGSETRHIQLWYSTGSRCVWAAETNGQSGDIIWVFNRNTGAEAITQLGGHSGDTAEIDDAGTQSHACMLPVYSGAPVTCTPYF